ncbi:MAG: beta-N-acetylhexosaminidase [Thioalkalivibrionaceae bacterium]
MSEQNHRQLDLGLRPPGPITCGVAGLKLTARERDRLAHPAIGGVILFKRNFADPDQLRMLVESIRTARDGPLVISVDHEGGRVQRFRQGFTAVPAMRLLGLVYDVDRVAACGVARALGTLMALELARCGVDHSYTPVLDLDYGASAIIGDRAFHGDPNAVAVLAGALIDGLQSAGMAGCGKHFPGHGAVRADSHEELPDDPRPLAELERDMAPYRLLASGPGARLAAVMPAHVRFSAVDQQPAGVSPYWLAEILRGSLGFDGAIISDDLAMGATAAMGGPIAAGGAALDAGADVLLSCNDPGITEALLAMAMDHPRTFARESINRRLALLMDQQRLAAAINERSVADRRADLSASLAPWRSLERAADVTAPAVGEP